MLSLLFPAPKRLPFGGRTYLAHPLRLRDLAYLEQWAAGVLGDAGERLADVLAVPDAPARHDALRELYELHERGGLALGSPEVSALMGTIDGQAEQLRISLRAEGAPEVMLSLDVCREIAAHATHEEWFAWTTFAHQAHPVDDVARAIDAEIGVTWPTPRPRSDATTPGESWMAVAWKVIEVTGWTFDELGALTLGQWDVVRAAGKPREQCYAVPGDYPDGVDPREFDERVLVPRERFWEESQSSDVR